MPTASVRATMRLMERPETRYARTVDGVAIAYQVIGEGPFDLVYVPGWISNVDVGWDLPLRAGEHELNGVPDRWRLVRVTS